MFGKNPIRAPIKEGGDSLDIVEIFSTIQGEGIYAGWPSIFLRLGGCNLACSFCDTEFEDFENIHIRDILKTIDKESKNINGEKVRKLIVITGGEPMRQPIEKICEELIKQGFMVQIETNGTIFRNLNDNVDIVCSPKNTSNGYKRIREDLLPKINAFKFIISKNNEDYNNISEVGQSDYSIPVYVQPMDEYDDVMNAENVKYTAKLAQEKGYLLSMQLHKILSIR